MKIFFAHLICDVNVRRHQVSERRACQVLGATKMKWRRGEALELDFNRLKTALEAGQPDRVPLFDFVVSQEVKEGFPGRSIDSLEDEIEFCAKAGYDFMIANVYAKYPCILKKTSSVRNGFGWRNDHVGPIATAGDVATYPWPDSERIEYSVLDRTEASLPRVMKVITVAVNFYQAMVELLGFENFAISFKQNTELVIEVLNRVAKIAIDILQRVKKFPSVGAVVIGGDIAYQNGTMVVPHFLRKFAFQRH